MPFLGNQLSCDVDIAICTIEKANMIVNQLLEEHKVKKRALYSCRGADVDGGERGIHS